MLKRQLALEKAQGYRGPATRFFARIETLAEADLVIDECCVALLLIAGIQTLLTVALGYGSLEIALLWAMGAGALWVVRGVATGALIVLLCAVILSLRILFLVQYPIGVIQGLLLAAVQTAVSARALEATVRRRKLRAQASSTTLPDTSRRETTD